MKRAELINWIIAVIGLVGSVIQIGYFIIDVFDAKSYEPRGGDIPILMFIITGFLIFYGWTVFAYYRSASTVKNLNRVRRTRHISHYEKQHAAERIAERASKFTAIVVFPAVFVWIGALFLIALDSAPTLFVVAISAFIAGVVTLGLHWVVSLFVSALLLLVFTDSAIYWESA